MHSQATRQQLLLMVQSHGAAYGASMTQHMLSQTSLPLAALMMKFVQLRKPHLPQDD